MRRTCNLPARLALIPAPGLGATLGGSALGASAPVGFENSSRTTQA
jgi:hypothetical protein